jgi:hypothetical protein
MILRHRRFARLAQLVEPIEQLWLIDFHPLRIRVEQRKRFRKELGGRFVGRIERNRFDFFLGYKLLEGFLNVILVSMTWPNSWAKVIALSGSTPNLPPKNNVGLALSKMMTVLLAPMVAVKPDSLGTSTNPLY